MNALSTKQKLVLQGFMWKRCIIREEASDMLNKLSITEDLDQYIRSINQMIAPFRMKISKGLDEETGHVHYALVNLADNHLSRLYDLYTPAQLDVIRRALDMVITSPKCAFSFRRLIDRSFQMGTKLTIGAIRQLLNQLVIQQFFARVDGRYTLGVRGCIEMQPYYSIHYASLVEVCNACKVFCIRGEHCASCNIKLHFWCLSRCISELQGLCPSCNQQWQSRADQYADEGSDNEIGMVCHSQIPCTQVVSDNEDDERPLTQRVRSTLPRLTNSNGINDHQTSSPSESSTRNSKHRKGNWKRGRELNSDSD